MYIIIRGQVLEKIVLELRGNVVGKVVERGQGAEFLSGGEDSEGVAGMFHERKKNTYNSQECKN